MSVWKLVSGILSMILSVIVLLQSCAVGLASSLARSDDLAGSYGLIVSILILAGGIVNVATSRSLGKGGSIASMILFSLGAMSALKGFSYKVYGDLIVWGAWCVICGILALVDVCVSPKKSTVNRMD